MNFLSYIYLDLFKIEMNSIIIINIMILNFHKFFISTAEILSRYSLHFIIIIIIIIFNYQIFFI
jgi:hypothetical protein